MWVHNFSSATTARIVSPTRSNSPRYPNDNTRQFFNCAMTSWPDDGGRQAFTVERLDGDAARDDHTKGTVIAEGRTGDEAATADGGRTWAGRVADPFYFDLSLLAAVDKAVLHDEDIAFTDHTPDTASNTLDGSTVNAIVLTVPHTNAELRPERDVATWATAKLATDAGGWRQVGRNGLPMIWPIFRDADSDGASKANTTHPADDRTEYAPAITRLVAGVVRRRGTAADPDAYATAVVDRLVPDVLPYRVGTPAAFGFAGFNGRRLADNAPEVMFSLATNCAVPTGLLAKQFPRIRSGAFPYVVPAEDT